MRTRSCFLQTRAPALILALAASVTLAGCLAEPKEAQEPIRPVRTTIAEIETAASLLRLPGEIRPRHEVRVGFRVGGKLTSREVEVGDRIRAGQTLARLDAGDFQLALDAQRAAVTAARTDLELASIELARVSTLRRSDFSSQAEYDRRKAMADAARARLGAAEAQLGQIRNQATYATLNADFDAVVTAVEAEVGQVVAAGQPVVRLARPEEKEIMVAVPESRLPEMRAAKTFEISVPALPGRIWTGTLRELSPLADAATRTFAARISLPDDKDGPALGPALGMSATVTIPDQGPPRVRLPLAAIYTRDGAPAVWVIDPKNSTVQRVAVETGGVEGNMIRVVAGLKGGEQVVTAGANLIRPGQSVRVVAGLQ